MIDISTLPLLKGKKALVTGIANDQSIAYGCAKAFRAFGADLAITYRNDKAKQFVEPLGQGTRSIDLHAARCSGRRPVGGSVRTRSKSNGASSTSASIPSPSLPRQTCKGRVVDCSKEGFLLAMEVSCWSFIRMAKLAEPLMKDGGTLSTMTYYGSQMVVENYNMMGPVKAALEAVTRYLAAELGPKGIRVHAISPGPLKTRAASGITDFDKLMRRLSRRRPPAASCRSRMSASRWPSSP